jgi:hypothetical protein
MAKREGVKDSMTRQFRQAAANERRLLKREQRAEQQLAELRVELARDQERLAKAEARIERRQTELAAAEALLKDRQLARAAGPESLGSGAAVETVGTVLSSDDAATADGSAGKPATTVTGAPAVPKPPSNGLPRRRDSRRSSADPATAKTRST